MVYHAPLLKKLNGGYGVGVGVEQVDDVGGELCENGLIFFRNIVSHGCQCPWFSPCVKARAWTKVASEGYLPIRGTIKHGFKI